MFDRWEREVPANTSESDAIKVECRVSPGMLQQLRMFIPQGSKKFVGCRVLLGERPIAPKSEGLHITGEGYVVDLRDMREPITEDRPILHWYLWNDDASYAHTPWMSAQWLSIEVPYEKELLEEMREFVKAFGKMIGLKKGATP